MLPQSKMPRATGSPRRRAACGAMVPAGRKSITLLDSYPLNYGAVSPVWHQQKFRLLADSLPSAL